jgi:membrane carboxypeptidase/penicillin-binding protein
MNWEAFAAVSTAFTGLVILATAVAAVREVRIAGEHSRATRAQLEHLRKATQFEGALAVFAELDTPFQMYARRFVQFELAELMKSERFREEVALIAGADELEHKELTVLRCFERIGTYVRKGWVDPDVVYMVASGRVIITWRALEEVVAIHRGITGPRFWENFERLYYECLEWMRKRDVNIDELVARQTRTHQRV